MKPDIIDHRGIQPPEQVKRVDVGVSVGGLVGRWVGG